MPLPPVRYLSFALFPQTAEVLFNESVFGVAEGLAHSPARQSIKNHIISANKLSSLEIKCHCKLLTLGAIYFNNLVISNIGSGYGWILRLEIRGLNF